MGDRTDTSQDALIAYLSEPSSYTPPPESVEQIDTHGAIVFLAGDRALKIKRAVKLAYLDFSTLAKRRRACEREVEINRITAPRIYLGTVAITRRSDGRLEIGGDGEVVEWAVGNGALRSAGPARPDGGRGPPAGHVDGTARRPYRGLS